MPRPLLIFSQSDYLIQIVDIKSHTERQTVQIQISRFFRSQLIWICTVCKGRVYPDSAGQGLILVMWIIFFLFGFKYDFHNLQSSLWLNIHFIHIFESTFIYHWYSSVFYSRFKTSIFYCRLPDNRVPFAISLITQQSATSHNLLPVRSQIVKPEDKKSFAVCVSPLFGKYNSSYELIQWIELNRILGAELFVFYNYSTGANIDDILRFYEKKGLVQIVQWNLTKFRLGSKPELVYIGQHSAMNDCLMKVKNVSEYVVNIDLDEFIVPHSNLSTWLDIVQKVPKRSGYTFRSSFFRLNWDNTDRQFLRKDRAEKLHHF